MSNRTKYLVGGVALAVIAWWLLPGWLTWLIVVAVIAAPVIGYFALDPSQRKRITRIRGRRQLR